MLPGKPLGLPGRSWCAPQALKTFHQTPPRGHHSPEKRLQALLHGIQSFPKSTGLCWWWKSYSRQECVSVTKFSTRTGLQRGWALEQLIEKSKGANKLNLDMSFSPCADLAAVRMVRSPVVTHILCLLFEAASHHVPAFKHHPNTPPCF